MQVSKQHSRSTAAKKALFIDGILRHDGKVVPACAVAGISRRLPYHWAKTDREFARRWKEATEDAGQLITQRALGDWRAELARLQAELAEVEAALADVAALAMAGDADAQQRQAELRARHQAAQEAVQALRLAITSGEAHLQTQAQERAARDREAAKHEADELAQQQRAAAERVDAALRDLECGWSAFVAIAGQRQGAARRAGGRSRAAFDAQLVQAVHVLAPAIAQALGVGGRAPRRGRPLSETVA